MNIVLTVEMAEQQGITHKECTKCGRSKSLDKFRIRPSRAKTATKGSYRSRCRKCEGEDAKDYLKRNPDKAVQYNKNRNAAFRALPLEHPYKIRNRKYSKKYNADPVNKARNSEYGKKRWANMSPEEKSAKIKKDEENSKIRAANDPLYLLKRRLRNNVRGAFNRTRWKKDNTSLEILGEDYETCMKLVGAPKPGHHYDHIIPLSLAETKEDLRALCSVYNLRQIPAEANNSKYNKLPSIFELRPGLPPLAFEVYMRNV